MDTIEQLKDFYRKNGISALDFQCPSRARCEKAAESYSRKFTTAREIVLGERYLDSSPRIVVVSLDSGNDDQTPDEK